MTRKYIDVWDTDHFKVIAMVTSEGRVVFRTVSQEYVQGECLRYLFWSWGLSGSIGWSHPRRSIWPWCRRPSIGEAMRCVVDDVQRKESRLREAQAQVNATKATVEALVDIEKEIGRALDGAA